MDLLSKDDKGRQIASDLAAADAILRDDELDTLLLRNMSEDARRYISSFPWCKGILASYFGGGVGGIFAIFFFHIRPSLSEIDPWIWIVVGDAPPSYLPLSDCDSPAEVFRTYVLGMSRWVEVARRRDREAAAAPDIPPVDLPLTPEWAEKVNQKLYGLTLALKPLFDDKSDSDSESDFVN